MLEHKSIRSLEDFFVPLGSRQEKGVYFYRINGFNQQIAAFVKKYYDLARRSGVILEGKIPNPDEKNLSYYGEIMGDSFVMSLDFITRGLAKWLPRMTDYQRNTVSAAIFDNLQNMQRSGKTENMLKNAYVKFMCWLYYKFERITSQLGENNVPKILYEGSISNYELMLISILSNAGCDVVLLQHQGDGPYLKTDPTGALSDELKMPDMGPFPEGWSLKSVRDELQRDFDNQRLYGAMPDITNCTNAWQKEGRGLDDIRTPIGSRGSDPKLWYNVFCRINGVWDKMVYSNDLFTFYQELKNAGRKIVVINGEIPKPTPEEIAGISRKNYTKTDQMLMDLISNINFSSSTELTAIMRKLFVDTMLAESKKTEGNLGRLTNRAVYLLCWMRRYLPKLFASWRMPQVGCLIYMGGCATEQEAQFISMVARLPADVLILCPNRNKTCCLSDPLLYELNQKESMSNITVFPEERSQIRIGTISFHAERELDTLMYEDTGLYRDKQYGRANTINLQTMYEEIKILWDQELKYRPNFSTVDGVVNMPVIYSKVSGVKNSELMPYWASIKNLLTSDTILISSPPYIDPLTFNPMKEPAVSFYKNGRLLKEKIRQHPKYGYGILREDMQMHMLDKLDRMIQEKLIKGIGVNGTEYTVIATALNLPRDIVRRIQQFDFTKKNPKIVYVNTTETPISLEDSVFTLYLSLLGFDVVFFVPTGYQSVEQYFAGSAPEEHQIGPYVYDTVVPDLYNLQVNTKRSWMDLFRR